MKVIKIGKLNIVWDWVEEVKWLSFISGIFLSIGIIGLILVNNDFKYNISMVLLISGIIGFLISAMITNLIISENHKICSKV